MDTNRYQDRVEEWLTACFEPNVRMDGLERTHRFLEEALELAQSAGCPREHAIALVDYVYGRPKGEPDQEVGGVMVTFAAFCSVAGMSIQEAADRGLAGNWHKIDGIRRKQAAKPSGSPLPQ